MWRVPLLSVVLLLLGTSSATAQYTPDDFQCVPCEDDACTADGATSGDVVCGLPSTTPQHSPRIHPRFGLELPGLSPPAAELTADTVMPLPPPPNRDGRFIRLYGDDKLAADNLAAAGGPHDDRTAHVDTDDVATPTGVDDEFVGEIEREAGQPPVLRIHQDDEHAQVEQPDGIEQFDEPDQQQQEPQELPELIVGHVNWEFIPVVEVTDVDGAITEVDAQRTLQADEDALADCFHPTDYPDGGAVNVDLYVSYNGIVQSVNGTADDLAPNQARCILKRAWRYDFPRVAGDADQPSRVRYQVQFVGQPTDGPDLDTQRPRLLLEQLRTSEPELDAAIADAMVPRLYDAEACAARGLDELPSDMLATQVRGKWSRTDDGEYDASQLDITVHNKTSSELPSDQLVDCYRQAMHDWNFDVDADELEEVNGLPDQLGASFWLTVRPAGWPGM